MTLNNL